MATGTLTNRILDPSGTAVPNVVVNARLMPGSSGFTPTPFYEITQLKSTTSDSNGDWTLTLEINTDISPGDSYYEIEELIPGANGVPVIHAVQVASGSRTLMASLVSTPPTTAAPSYITQSSGDARYAPLGGGGAATIGVNIQPVGTATVTGTATTVASSGHAHPLSPAVVGWGLSLTAGVLSVNSNSMTTTVTIPTVGATPTVITTQTVTGTATQYAPSNHGHVLGAVTAGNDIAISAGTINVTPRVPLVGAIPIVVATNTITGTSTAYAPANHGHVLGAVVAGNDIAITDGTINVTPRVPIVGSFIQAVGTNTQTGTSTAYARDNHAHILSPAVVGAGLTYTAGVVSVTVPFVATGEIQPVGTNTATGTATTAAPSNHVHPLNPSIAGTGLTLLAGVLAANVRAPVVTYLTSTITATYAVTTGTRGLLVEMWGGGGGGGGCAGSATQAGGGSGGASGSYARKFYTSTTATYLYCLGAGGAGATAGANNGTAAGPSTWANAAIIAPGGGGGFAGTLGTVAFNGPRGGSPGAISTGGDVNATGTNGGPAYVNSATDSRGGPGGPSQLGGGADYTSANADGLAATSPASGGSGGRVASVNTNRAGGNGATGLIIVTEIYGN